MKKHKNDVPLEEIKLFTAKVTWYFFCLNSKTKPRQNTNHVILQQNVPFWLLT